MTTAYEKLKNELRTTPKTWLITGVAGFIGSNLLEELLTLGQKVVGLDNFSTGHKKNLDEVKKITGENWSNFRFIEGDITKLVDCENAVKNVDFVLHQAALGSVPRSIEDPIATNESNVVGFLNMLLAARNVEAKRFVYAASSSTYGDHPGLPKIEENIGNPLSPYAVTKYVNELYADVFARAYGFESIGLRYFNVFGKRQDPDGPYAAVIPKWIDAMIKGDEVFINGDGETSRDFCFVANAVQANILAATTRDETSVNKVYNVAVGQRTTLNELYNQLQNSLSASINNFKLSKPTYRDFRAGDVKHSLADISKAKNLLGYAPSHDVQSGLAEAMNWYIANL